MHEDQEREYKYIDIDKINRSEIQPTEGTCEDVLFDGLTDVIQLAEAEGMSEEEIESVLRRIAEYRADRNRRRFTLHTNDD